MGYAKLLASCSKTTNVPGDFLFAFVVENLNSRA